MLPRAVVTAALLNPPLLVKLFSCYPALCSPPRCSLELTALYLKAAFVRSRGSLDKLFPSQPLPWPQPVQGCSPPKRGQPAHSVSPLWAAHRKAGTPGLGWGCRTPGGLPYPGRIALPEPFHPCQQSLRRGCDSPSAARLLPELAGRSRAETPGWQPCLAGLACESVLSCPAAWKEPQALILLLGCSPLSSVLAKLRDSHPLGVQSRRLWHQPSSRQAQESCHQHPRATCSAGRQVFPSTLAVWRDSSVFLWVSWWGNHTDNPLSLPVGALLHQGKLTPSSCLWRATEGTSRYHTGPAGPSFYLGDHQIIFCRIV